MNDIKEYIIKKFKLKSPPDVIIGDDGRYHTVYFIMFSNGCFYVGKHTSDDISNDSYFCSSKLGKGLKRLGIKYEREIICYVKDSSDAILLEQKILEDSTYYNNDLCLNCYQGSPPDACGSIVISKGNKFKMINPKLLETYLNNGWIKSPPKRIFIYKNEINKRVLEDELDSYISDGWIIGSLHARGRTFIYKNGEYRFVIKNELNYYLDNGWIKQHPHQGRKVLEKNGEKIKVLAEDVEFYISDGWSFSGTLSGRKTLIKDGEIISVTTDELQSYMNSGWVRGNTMSNKIYINNGITEKRIDKEDISNYPDWSLGGLMKIGLHLNGKYKVAKINDIEKIKNLLDSGYVPKNIPLTNEPLRTILLSHSSSERELK